MEIDIIFKIAGVGIITAVTNQVLKHSGKDEITMLTTLAGVVIVLFMLINMISELFNTIKTLFNF